MPPITVKAVCKSTLGKRKGRFEFQRGILNQDESGQLTVTKTGEQGSGLLTSMSQANCFILLSSDIEAVASGEMVSVQPFMNFI